MKKVINWFKGLFKKEPVWNPQREKINPALASSPVPFGKVTEEMIQEFLKDLKPPEPDTFIFISNCRERGLIRYCNTTPLCANPSCAVCSSLREGMIEYVDKIDLSKYES